MDGPIRRAAIVEDDDKCPTKEEMAREILILKKCLKEAHAIMLKRNEQMQEERVQWTMWMQALTNEKNRAVMERAHWRREAKRYAEKLNPERVKHDDGQTDPTAEEAIAFELEMEAIANEDMEIDEVAEMTMKMKERSGE